MTERYPVAGEEVLLQWEYCFLYPYANWSTAKQCQENFYIVRTITVSVFQSKIYTQMQYSIEYSIGRTCAAGSPQKFYSKHNLIKLYVVS